MKNLPAPKNNKIQEMASEYQFDYTKAKPNRFAKKIKASSPLIVVDEVNKALRALISAMPPKKSKIATK